MVSIRVGCGVIATLAKGFPLPTSIARNRQLVGRSTRLFCAETTNTLHIKVPTNEDMEDIGALLATLIVEEHEKNSSSRGSVVFLKGDLGAGKTTLARGFVRAATGIDDLRVTSPTFLLSNSYPIASDHNLELYHMDLYRLSGTTSTEFALLHLDHVFPSCISLVEWPIRLPSELVPPERLDVTITLDKKMEDHRDVTMEAIGFKLQHCIDTLRKEGYLDDLIVGNV